MPAPDFPCGGQIITPKDEIRAIYRSGRGKLRVRARWHFEDLARGQWQLVIDELPPAASARSILDRIEQISNPRPKKDKKTLSAKQQQAKERDAFAARQCARDESGKSVDVRLVFEPKTSKVDRDEFVNYLLSETDLESNVPVNLVMLGLDGKPRQKACSKFCRIGSHFGWRSFAGVQRRVWRRCSDRIHVLEGRSLVLLNIDRVIAIIRNADDPKADLIKEFGLTDRQADDIL